MGTLYLLLYMLIWYREEKLEIQRRRHKTFEMNQVHSVQAVFLPAEVDWRREGREGCFSLLDAGQELKTATNWMHTRGSFAYIWGPLGSVNNAGISSVNTERAAISTSGSKQTKFPLEVIVSARSTWSPQHLCLGHNLKKTKKTVLRWCIAENIKLYSIVWQ